MYLNCKSYFSFRYGTFATEELVKTGVAQGATALALTNINGTPDAWNFVQDCRQAGIKPIVGAEIRNGSKLLYVLLASNNSGFTWINHFISEHLENKKPFPVIADNHPFFFDTWDGFVIYPLGTKTPDKLFCNERIGVQPSEINKLFRVPVANYSSKFIVRHPVTFKNNSFYNVHKLLRAIDKNVLGSKLPATELASIHEYFMPQEKILEIFCNYPSIITNTYRVIDACNIEMDFHTDKNKKTFTGSKESDIELLKSLANIGLQERYGDNSAALERVNKELGIIESLGFTAYFLITWDIVRESKSRGFYHVGRGSGANSIVAYCLKITEVDPIELNLFFERFLNPERTSPPDFDIDWSWLDRDEIIQYVFKKHGKEHVSLLGSYATFQYNAVVRELGKVFGLPSSEIDRLGEKGYYYGEGRAQNFSKKQQDDDYHRLILQYGKLINGFPNHLSIHAGGILISDEPIHAYTATHMPPKGFVTSQIDMYVAENIGLYKLDVLSQRGLGHIKETIRLVKQNQNIAINIDNVALFKKDEGVKKQIREVNTIGCFYIESPAMRQLLKKLPCDKYENLVVASSIIRPGVASSGMMREYITRYHNPGKFTYLHPKMKELLEETFGVMVFQEDVIKVAHYFAGLSMGEADTLRRAMSAKYRSNNKFELIREKYFKNCKKLFYPDALSAEVWRQMESFAGYSFCKAHSASFAIESFQDLFLKAYFPLEFMVGVINNFGGFYSTELYFIELRKTGASIHLPCVNRSEYLTSIKGKHVYVGLVHLKDFEEQLAKKIIEERQKKGAYIHLQDFVERTRITREQLEILVSIGAFRFTGKTKKQLLWEADYLVKRNKKHDVISTLFEEKPVAFELPDLNDNPLDNIYDEVEILGFPLRNPFELVADIDYPVISAKDLAKHMGKYVTTLVYFIDHKVVPTKNDTTMSFGTFLDPNLDWIDTIHFPQAFQNFPLKGKGFYKISGRVVDDFGVYSLEVASMIKIGYKERKYANL